MVRRCKAPLRFAIGNDFVNGMIDDAGCAYHNHIAVRKKLRDLIRRIEFASCRHILLKNIDILCHGFCFGQNGSKPSNHKKCIRFTKGKRIEYISRIPILP